MNFINALVGLADMVASAESTAKADATVKPALPRTLTQTQKVLASMMRENTGASILDSGGAYGRNWERNQATNFAEVLAHPVSLEWDLYDGKASPNVTIETFAFLSEAVTYDRGLTKQIAKLAASDKYANASWLEIMRAFPAYIAKVRDVDDGEAFTVNSYNGDSFLSQVIQYHAFSLDGVDYVALQIHGGCDIRGGYTAPRVFQAHDCDITLGDDHRASVGPSYVERSEIAARLLANLTANPVLFASLDKDVRREASLIEDGDIRWDVGSYDDNGEDCKPLDSYPAKEIKERSEWVRGVVCILPDRSALCPVTGSVLEAWFN